MAPVKMAIKSATKTMTTATKMLRRRWRCLSSGVRDLRLLVVWVLAGGGSAPGSVRWTGCGVRSPMSPLVPGTGLVEVCPCSRASIRLRRSSRSFSALFIRGFPPFQNMSVGPEGYSAG